MRRREEWYQPQPDDWHGLFALLPQLLFLLLLLFEEQLIVHINMTKKVAASNFFMGSPIAATVV